MSAPARLSLALTLLEMLVKIGNREVLFSATIMVPDGEEASFSHLIAEGDSLNCTLKFVNEPADVKGKKTTIQSDFDNQVFTITFNNFESSLGHSTNKPVVIGVSNKDEPISFLATIFKLKTFTKVEMQVMLEARP